MTHDSSLLDDPVLRDLPVVDGTKRLGPCRLLAKIGRGGAGAVYLAHHENLGIQVAVKCLKRSLVEEDPKVVARFRNEARVAATLNHPNLIRVYDVGEDCGLHFMIMEFAAGETLKAKVKREGPQSVLAATTLAAAAARGLSAAHRRGVVHRDVKPDNILVSPLGEVKVLDLGIAKTLECDDGRTLTQLLVGTPQYMAPEQWEDSRVITPATDIYGLGCTLFFLLAGKPPFESGTPMEVMKRVCLKPFPDIRKRRTDIPFPLLAILTDCVARNAKDRPRDADALIAQLDDFLGKSSDRVVPLAHHPDAADAVDAESEDFTPSSTSSRFDRDLSFRPVPAAANENTSAIRVISARRNPRRTKSTDPTPFPTRMIAILAGAFVLAIGGGIWIASSGGANDSGARAGESTTEPSSDADPVRSLFIAERRIEDRDRHVLTTSRPTLRVQINGEPTNLSVKVGGEPVTPTWSRGELQATLNLSEDRDTTVTISRGQRIWRTFVLFVDRRPPSVRVIFGATERELVSGITHILPAAGRIQVEFQDRSALIWTDQRMTTERLQRIADPEPTPANRLWAWFVLPTEGEAGLSISAKDSLGNVGDLQHFRFGVEAPLEVLRATLDDAPLLNRQLVGRATSRLVLDLSRPAANPLRVTVGGGFSRDPYVTKVPPSDTTRVFLDVPWGVDNDATDRRTLTVVDDLTRAALGEWNVLVDRVAPRIEFLGGGSGRVRAAQGGTITARITDVGELAPATLLVTGGDPPSSMPTGNGIAVTLRVTSFPTNVTVSIADRAGNVASETVTVLAP